MRKAHSMLASVRVRTRAASCNALVCAHPSASTPSKAASSGLTASLPGLKTQASAVDTPLRVRHAQVALLNHRLGRACCLWI